MSFVSDFTNIHGYAPMSDPSMFSAVKAFFTDGVNPGSCLEAIINGDYDGAVAKAHRNLLQVEDSVYSTHRGRQKIECLYSTYRFLLGDFVCNYDEWPGYKNIPEYEQAMIFLQTPHLHQWINDCTQTKVYLNV